MFHSLLEFAHYCYKIDTKGDVILYFSGFSMYN